MAEGKLRPDGHANPLERARAAARGPREEDPTAEARRARARQGAQGPRFLRRGRAALRRPLGKHPEEKEYLDRARMYLGACRAGKKTKGTAAAEPEELYHAAVFEKNRGNVDKALDLLRRNAGRRDGDGRVHYLTACCFALQGDVDQALQSLKKAIAADDQNRIQARLEADLAALRGTQGFTELVAGGA